MSKNTEKEQQTEPKRAANGRVLKTPAELAEINEEDEKFFKLLDLMDKYEHIANGPFREKFIDGFLNLSKANFRGDRKFGADCFDKRPYPAAKIVSNMELVDLRKTKKETTDSDNEKLLRNRKRKEKTEKTESTDFPQVRDPMYQFGTLVPSQLRQAQTDFSLAVARAAELVRLKQQITQLSLELQ